ncbi:LysR family transcriptional regulator [Noviherbaspirillum aerium]|uniref:LysR family transcriptional regulator n=1 Tax=Noviherbaspirillum aerium TaxID=2588497 RepID=UPI00124E87EE|nr:LysR family transcriptional regulator [Noviherbaspirillum aerium]
MDKVKAMQTFVRIVEANSFTKAAETLNLPRASLTATMQNLEGFLGVQLLQRTTRRLSVTPEGMEYYKQCVEILGAIDTAEMSFRGPAAQHPRGTLRVDMPGAVGRQVIVPRIGEFHALYSDVHLSLSLTDRVVDLTQEGVDCALRVGRLQDSSMVGRQIGSMRFVTCAAPSYLERYGVPRTLDDLARHRSVVHFSGRTGRAFDWEFMVDGKPVIMEIGGAIAINDADAYISCALQGLGMVQSATYQVRQHLKSGALVEVLADTPAMPLPVSLLYPQGRMAAPKLKVFADWISALFKAHSDLKP